MSQPTQKLRLGALIALVVGSMIGGGIFSLPQNMAARADAGLKDFRIHDLRHTRATRILRATHNLAAARDALKHRHIRTTLRYAHVLTEDTRAALEASESRNSPEIPKITGTKNAS